MEYSIKSLARLAGVSSRTLRWYDEIGLLCPSRKPNGYRYYGRLEVEKLQQILFYKQSGLALEAIAALLGGTAYDAVAAMEKHLASLKTQQKQLDALVKNAENTLLSLKGEKKMNDKERFEGFKQQMVDDNEAHYGQEVRERWGNTRIDASNAKMLKMTKEEYDAFTKLSEELNEVLAQAAADGDAAGALAQKAAGLHKAWLCHTWPSYSAEAHCGLTQMYLDDERFGAYYEKIAPGATHLLHDAVAIYTRQHGDED